MRSIGRHLRFSNVAAALALLIALSGGAYAANGPLAGTNTVGSRDIINEEVKSPDIGPGQVRSGDVADDSTGSALTGADIAANALDAGDIADTSSLGSAEINEASLRGREVLKSGERVFGVYAMQGQGPNLWTGISLETPAPQPIDT